MEHFFTIYVKIIETPKKQVHYLFKIYFTHWTHISIQAFHRTAKFPEEQLV